jgi:hypothetical protein
MHSNARPRNPFLTVERIVPARGVWRPGPLSYRERVRDFCTLPPGRGRLGWGWFLAISLMPLLSLTSCRATVGRVIGQQFVSSAYAFEVPLPGDAWQPVPDELSVLTLTHPHLAAGITISVTCDRERDVPLNILTRHLFFGFTHIEVLQQEPQTLNGIPALKTVARARLDAREVQVYSYVVRRDGCVYDMVYFASPQDFSRGEPSFERMMAGFRFLPR